MVDIAQYDYELPEGLIANKPAEPRDSSRLFVYGAEADLARLDVFSKLAEHIPKGALLVFNNTKVLPARVVLQKENGGKVEILFLVNEWNRISDVVYGMVDRKVQVGQKLYFDKENFVTAVGQNKNIFSFKLNFSTDKLFGLLIKYGSTPVPKYIGKDIPEEKELRDKYQSIFAENPASIAAPTASLHFTEDVFAGLKEKGIETCFITLHVGMGTFAPVTVDNIKEKKLHEEFYEISEDTAEKIRKARKEGRPVIAVGTTTARALESSEILRGSDLRNGKTSIFIYSPYEFKVIDGLITNFHLPKSSLMMLVDAFLQFKGAKKDILKLYNIAIKEKFRFYSFGDAMLII